MGSLSAASEKTYKTDWYFGVYTEGWVEGVPGVQTFAGFPYSYFLLGAKESEFN
jgi:hypothetical protein